MRVDVQARRELKVVEVARRARNERRCAGDRAACRNEGREALLRRDHRLVADDAGDARVGRGQRVVGRREHDARLVGEVADQRGPQLVAERELGRALREIEPHERRGADVHRDRLRHGRRVAVVGDEHEACVPTEGRGRHEHHRRAVAGEVRRPVRRRDDAVGQRVALRVGHERRDGDGGLELDVREARAGADLGCLVRREAEIREDEMAVRRVDVAVAVHVGRAARGAERSRQRGGVETVDDGVAVHISCGAQVEHVRAAPAAADSQRQQAGRGDPVDRRRRSGCRPRDDRLQPLDDRQCRSECGATAGAHLDREQEGTALRQRHLARAHCERVQIDPARREHTADRMREVADRGAEIGGDGTCRDRGTVRDGDAASRSGHEREQVARRIGVRVALGGPG